MAVEFVVGVFLALSVGLLATFVGFERDRAFYPTVLIVIALYYALFAVMGGSVRALAIESIVIVAFVGASIVGFRKSLWLVVAAFAGHGLFDFIHGHLIVNPGVPVWWPLFCLSFDVAAAAYLAWRLVQSKVRAAAT